MNLLCYLTQYTNLILLLCQKYHALEFAFSFHGLQICIMYAHPIIGEQLSIYLSSSLMCSDFDSHVHVMPNLMLLCQNVSLHSQTENIRTISLQSTRIICPSFQSLSYPTPRTKPSKKKTRMTRMIAAATIPIQRRYHD